MRAAVAIASSVLLMAAPAAASASPVGNAREAEGCQVQNPVQPACTYTVTHSSDSPVSGIAGLGSWVVKIKTGKKKKPEVIKSPASGEPTVVEMSLPEGATVSVEAVTPGSAAIVGHVD